MQVTGFLYGRELVTYTYNNWVNSFDNSRVKITQEIAIATHSDLIIAFNKED